MRSHRALVAAVLTAVTVTGCAGSGTPTNVLEPRAAPSSPLTVAPAGTTTDIGSAVISTALDPRSRTLALLVAAPDRVLLLDATDLTVPPRSVALPARGHEVVAGDGELLVATAAGVVRVDPTTAVASLLAMDTDVLSVAVLPDDELAVGLSTGVVRVVAADGRTAAEIGGLASADAVRVAGDDLVALDRRQTSLTAVNTADEALAEALRAGEGAARATTDRFGRVLVTEPVRGELLVFSTSPLMLLQRFPVPGGPWAVAVDPVTDIAWVTLTATNEVVGFDVAGPEPVELDRYPTLSRPESVAVDPADGAVLVASATGEGVQRIPRP
ncbi:hypothetical protein RHODO2019_01265 [Rhodococcus antarcticus]|uniref:Lipoprotein n=1 Tax=Rhodococcus antarcticus TaxID=2987751 RepID=A0ABY6P0K6_9NOCA|nr:hypothetical protein [Rhodococcus antarcticus]UZJ25170.1 hypothetical protein RHODO2019_01265 [Rhodococcus antarcticus]